MTRKRNDRFSSWALFLALGCGMWPAACSRDGSLPGDRCHEDHDCKAPLVCSVKADPEASEGICVYPEAIPVDAAPEESLPDTGVDSGVVHDAGSEDASAQQ